MIECAECGAPAEATGSALMTGVDYDGSDAVFEVLKIECAAGHRYNKDGGEMTRPKEFNVKLKMMQDYTYFTFEQLVSAESDYHALAKVLSGRTRPDGEVIEITIREAPDGR